MSDECRFGPNHYCETHVEFAPIGGGYKKGADPSLCGFAAAALQAEVTRLNEVCGTNEALLVSINQLHDAAQARVRELEASLKVIETDTYPGQVKYLIDRLSRAEQAVGRMREWDRTWYPILAGRLIALQQSGEQVAADRWRGLILELRAALSSQEQP